MWIEDFKARECSLGDEVSDRTVEGVGEKGHEHRRRKGTGGAELASPPWC